jgi:hypothetical protein
MLRPVARARQPKIPLLRRCSIGINARPVSHGAPPHTAVFERDPQVPSRIVQKLAQLIEILRSSTARTEILSLTLFDLRKIRLEKKFVRNIVPPKMDLVVRMGHSPPTTTLAVFHKAN